MYTHVHGYKNHTQPNPIVIIIDFETCNNLGNDV